MTAIKQVSVCSRSHLRSLESYLDWGREKAIGRGSQNIIDESRWAAEMDETREAYGHNEAGKAGARCTYMQHQVLAFNPDECDINGGKMTPEDCLDYAREWVSNRYPDNEAVWVLHQEHASDGTDRYAIHVALNRTELGVGQRLGRRLDEGPARKAAVARAKAIREQDERWGLRQLERGRRNSRTHARQPSREERRVNERGEATENDRVRAIVAARATEVARERRAANPMRELAARLREDGVTMTLSAAGDDVQYRFQSESCGGERRVNGATMGEARNARTGRSVSLDLGGLRTVLSPGLYFAYETARLIAKIEREAEDEDERGL